MSGGAAMANCWAVLERPKDEAGAKRARFFMETFGAMHVPLICDRVAVLALHGAKEKRPYFMAAVYSSDEMARRFEASCLVRKNGEAVVSTARALGFYPVNVDGITLVRADTPLFGAHDEPRASESDSGQGDS